MNYRHAFHAGNFADLAKHAILTRLLRELTGRPAALTVIDTHAGAGLYDLAAEASRRTGEGEAGVARLMADAAAPAEFDDLEAAVRRVNAKGGARYYPGSPVLIAAALRPRDRYIACELRSDDAAALEQVLPRQLGALVHKGDGWAHAAKVAPAAPAALLVLIDAPFERGDDYEQAVRLTARLLSLNPGAVIAVWVPIKDLAAFDAFLGDIEDVARDAPEHRLPANAFLKQEPAGSRRSGRALKPDGQVVWSPRSFEILVAEARLRPLDDPMRLNGCALVVVNPPPGVDDHARAVVDWIARSLGDHGALGRVTRLGGGR